MQVTRTLLVYQRRFNEQYTKAFGGAERSNRIWCAGHGATVHAATIEDGSLVGMGATVLDGSKVSALPDFWLRQ